MSQVPAPSPLSDLPGADEEAPRQLEPTLVYALPRMPEVASLTDFELEIRQRLANVESHGGRTDTLLMALQLEQRQQFQALRAHIDARVDVLQRGIHALVQSVNALAPMLKKLTGNGHA